MKVGFQMVQFSNSQALTLAIAVVPTFWKPDHSKSGHFCLDFKRCLTKWRHLFRFQPDFRSYSKSGPTSFWPFEIQISPDFRSSLYCKIIFFVGEFLKQCKPFVEEGVHPRVIIRAFRRATNLVIIPTWSLRYFLIYICSHMLDLDKTCIE